MRRRALLANLIPASARADPALIAALRAGGLNIYLRHAITDRSQADRGRLGDRAGQRNLSAAGIAQAEALGAAWRRLRLPLGSVLASPVFRALDTARLAFGADAVRVEPFLTADDYTPDAGQFSRNIEQTRWHLAATPAAGNDVLVGHIVPLQMILHRALSQAEYPEGCLAVFSPGSGFLGFMPAEALISP
ncbi:histidine phosphatase family protein [Plastoroseomonas arctica]|uniref:histidine phosphatase family protein n=1 Tax=Plastoroseomonas arctica TaxID=1509237 RepID=UPI001BADBA53|nr:histidine phosphatase family protein [Plastoroseomonas arctica]